MHAAAEYLAVVSGSGAVTVDGRGDLPLAPGTIVTIPPRVQHQIHNDSGSEPLPTRYVGEPDKLAGCPHTHKAGHN